MSDRHVDPVRSPGTGGDPGAPGEGEYGRERDEHRLARDPQPTRDLPGRDQGEGIHAVERGEPGKVADGLDGRRRSRGGRPERQRSERAAPGPCTPGEGSVWP